MNVSSSLSSQQLNLGDHSPDSPLPSGDTHRSLYFQKPDPETLVAQSLGAFVSGNAGIRGLAEFSALQRFHVTKDGVRPTYGGLSFSNVGVKFRQSSEHGWELNVNPSDTVKLLSVLKPLLLRGSASGMVEALKSLVEVWERGPQLGKMFDFSVQVGETERGVPFVRFSVGMNITEALKIFPNLRPLLTLTNTISSAYGGVTIQFDPSIFHSSHPGKEAQEFKRATDKTGVSALFDEGRRLRSNSS